MDLNTFFGAIIRLVISQTAISKSICGNLNKRLKKRGIRTDVSRRDEVNTPPKVEVIEFWRGSDIVGFMLKVGGGRLLGVDVVPMESLSSHSTWCSITTKSGEDSHNNLFLAPVS